MERKDSYESCLEKYDTVVAIASAVSKTAANRPSPSAREYWASVLFTRLCCTGQSLLFLLPQNRWVEAKIEHWDFAAVASLARNLLECYLAFFYLCVDKASHNEWVCRVNLFNLHDCISRKQMFASTGSCEDQIESFEKQAQELRERLLNNPHFLSLSDKKRKDLLKGHNHYLYNQDELIMRMVEDVETFRFMYRFLSAQVHTMPLGFYRTGDKNRWLGLENTIERRYICLTLDYVHMYVLRGIKELIDFFPDLRGIRDLIDLFPDDLRGVRDFLFPDISQKMPQANLTQTECLKKERRAGRNEACPCGSKKKYKKCCGR